MKKLPDTRRRVPPRRRATRTRVAQRWLSKHWFESALLAVLAVVLGAVMLNHGASGGASTASGTAQATTNGSALPLTSATPQDAGNSLGKAQAPVTIINYSDFMCPYCTILANQIEPQLIHDYVDTGKVRYIVREGAFLTPQSQDAAEAAACAEDQGKYWQYHDLLYATRARQTQGIYTTSKLKGYAAQLGLNTGRFDACLDSHVHASEIKQLTQAALAGGVSGTPTVFINGQPLVGGQPFDAYRQAIDAALAQK